MIYRDIYNKKRRYGKKKRRKIKSEVKIHAITTYTQVFVRVPHLHVDVL